MSKSSRSRQPTAARGSVVPETPIHFLRLIVFSTLILASGALVAGNVHLGGLQPGQTFDQFIVMYRDVPPSAVASDALEDKLRAATNRVGIGRGNIGLDLVRHMHGNRAVVRTMHALGVSEAAQLMRAIAADPDVEYVEVDSVHRIFATPNDPHYGKQYGLGTGAGGIRAITAWDREASDLGAGVVVAVVDTGIAYHSDLQPNVVPGYDFIYDLNVANDGNRRDGNPADPGGNVVDCSGSGLPGGDEDDTSTQAADSNWHGTRVAGVVAAVANNSKGITGVAPRAKVLPVRVFGKCTGVGFDSDVADAIRWSAGGYVPGVPTNGNPAEVINLSFGTRATCSATLQSAINHAVSLGATVVAAAGNDGFSSNYSPANCNNVIVVAATDAAGNRWVESTAHSSWGSGVDLAAPGASIYSTSNAGTMAPGSETYEYQSGTSFAAPHVAGVVALLQASRSTPMTPAAVEII